jgi:glycosyltransferase involved in cell wall biosynthesis
MQNKIKRISVAMVTYNSEKFLRPQLDSILKNLFLNDEIIISDDGSTDGTIEMIKRYAKYDERVILVHNQINHGVDGNYENSIKHCKGDIIFLSDDDNVWEDNKVAIVTNAFLTNPKLIMIMHDCYVCDENLKIIDNSYLLNRKGKPGLLRNVWKTAYGGSLIAIRKEALKLILPFPKRLPCFYDEWIGSMCTKYGKVKFIDDKLSYWRRHSRSQSTAYLPKSKNRKLKRIWERIYLRIRKVWMIIRY